jgi:hypothetical protein
MQTIQVLLESQDNPLLSKAGELLARKIRHRSGLVVRTVPVRGKASVTVTLGVAPGIGAQGFRIEDGPGGVIRILGDDGRGAIYGVGKLLRTSRFEKGRFVPGAWRGTSVPAKPVRGMYFATHFHNFYHDAPVEKVIEYIEDLALWGCNTLSVWFDMHHYTGIGDPAARKMVQRLRVILEAAQAVGIGPALTMLGNEAYKGSPEALRADWTAGHDDYVKPPGGHYHVELCPSKPGGLDLILKWRQEVLDAFAGIDFAYIWIWPYDQGGCTCSRCKPWGANGFLRTAEPVARLIRKHFPAAKVVLSTWYFDKFTRGEWEGLDKAFTGGAPDWVDYLMADDWGGFPDYPLQHGVPGRLPIVGFAEISMEHMWPWGGWGANPRPHHWQEYWERAGGTLAGGFPYSEGIFEDINKATTLQLNWSPQRTPADIVYEYAASEFSPKVADDVLTACQLMEVNMGHFPVDVKQYMEAHPAAQGKLPQAPLFPLPRLFNPRRYLDLLKRAEAKLTVAVRKSWRWRILVLRAALDTELFASRGAPTRKSERYFDELTKIYGAQTAEWAVHPPSYAWLQKVYS